MRRTILLLVGTLALNGDTWKCITVNLGPSPTLTPVPGGCTAGDQYDQTATFHPFAYSAQTGANVWSNAEPVTGTGACLAVGVAGPQFAASLAPSGNTTIWSVAITNRVPASCGTLCWTYSSKYTTSAAVSIPSGPCACYPSDCANGTAKQQCTTTCATRTCAPPSQACGAQACYNPYTPCAQNGQVQCCNVGGSFAPCCVIGTGGSPIIVDPKGEGFHLTGPGDMVLFRLRAADASPVALTWADPQYRNAWLVLPVDGAVRGLDQMFGNFTPQPPSESRNGYAALAVYDRPDRGGNGDGRIDAHDRVWSSLRLWMGRPNAAGASDPGDLYRPEILGVFGFALDYVDSPKTDVNGNEFRYRSSVYLDPGLTRKDPRSYDVFLNWASWNR